MNILEAYLKKYSQFIILILGLPCTNKSAIAKELALDLNIKILNINNYLIKNKFIEKNINDINFKIYEDSNNYEWEKLNKDIDDSKSSGIILYGNFIDMEHIEYDIDFSFFYSMNLTLCKKILFEKKILQWNESDSKTKIYFENIFNPIYENIKEKIKFNKFFNIKEENKFDESYDEIFDLLMNLIKKKL